MINFTQLPHRRKGELLLVTIAILIDLAFSLADLRRFVDILFIEGMAAIIVGSLLVALSLKPSVTMSSVNRDPELTSIALEPGTSHRVLGTRILIVGIILVLFAIMIGEVWIRKLAWLSHVQI